MFLFFSNIINEHDVVYKIIKAEVNIDGVRRDIILKNISIYGLIKKIFSAKHDINDLIMYKKHIITDITLKNKNRTVSIKKLFDHYSDKSKFFDHYVYLLLNLKNIDFNLENDKIEIKYLCTLKPEVKEHNLKDVYKLHISDIYDV